MHPAYSVILFTTASGAGYGLIVLLSLGGLTGLLRPERGLGLAGFGLALALVTAGLLASTFHLGRPERAWRALSQWRSSWLSREGIAALATYPAAGLAALGWTALGTADGWFAAAGLLAALLSLATLVATGQIYQSLATVPQWHERLTTPVYVALALATGSVLLIALLHLVGRAGVAATGLTAGLLLAALLLKALYWIRIDGRGRGLTTGMATGLGAFGEVRPLDPPHTQPNYVMREMGYAVARRHAQRLRRIAAAALFLGPLVLVLLSLLLPTASATAAALMAVLSAALGVLVERWLFFAEAEHVSMLFYGRTPV